MRTCQVTGEPLSRVFCDLGTQPLANSYRAPDDDRPEPSWPLVVHVAESTGHVQLVPEVRSEAIFDDGYAYFSSFSTSWVEHARRYVDHMIGDHGIGPEHHVVEIASNDGYLLQWFVRAGIDALGIEPAANCAAAAEEKGVTSLVAFFTAALAGELVADRGRADLVIGNNVLAHQSSLLDFVDGVAILLDRRGLATFEFPHLGALIAGRQFDTIYHEHVSYLSLKVIDGVFRRVGMHVVDVERLATHGGSLRIFVAHRDSGRPVADAVGALLAEEQDHGLHDPEQLARFAQVPPLVRDHLLEFLADARATGRTVAAYGAPAKGNTLLNYCGIGVDDIAFTVDRSPHKQGLLLPGSHIPILAPEAIAERRPDDVLILPWNIADEIVEQMAHVRDWGGRFVTAIPDIRIL